MFILNAIAAFGNWFWGVPILILIIGGGIYITIRLGFVQFRHFGYAMSQTFGKMFKKNEEGKISSFGAACAALASTIGASNIVGVPVAIALGGPGAVFWIWLIALVGCATKWVEVSLGVKYREKNDAGEWVGGPFYYLRGLGAVGKVLGYIYAVVMNRLNRVGSREDIEDCVSSVLVELYSAIGDFSADKGSMKSYIGRIADRRAVDTFRRLTYRQNNTAGTVDELTDMPSGDDTEAETESRLMKKQLWEAVRSLGSPDSEIIVYQYYYNMRPRDIAQKLGMTTGAVRKRSQRARQKLSEILKG